MREVKTRDVSVFKWDASLPPLSGGARETQKLIGHEHAGNADVHYKRMAPGSLGGYHYHKHAENIWIVLQGTLEAVIGGVRYFVHENEIIFMPANVPHATGNPGDIELCAVEIYTPQNRNAAGELDSFPAEMPAEIPTATLEPIVGKSVLGPAHPR